MDKKIRIAHWFFMVSMCSWIFTMIITPVGGWSLHNPYRDYYMGAFCITGIIAFITLIVCYKLEKMPVDCIQGTDYDDYTEL